MLFLNNIIKKTRYKIFYVSTKKIKYCIFPSNFCDYTQFNSTKSHPHAGLDRGVFKEDLLGKIRIENSKWDFKPGILFSDLLEYKALLNHYNGKENWKKSKFAIRNTNYIKLNRIKNRGFNNPKIFLERRERQIDKLFQSIIKNGVLETKSNKDKKLFSDNISVVLTKDNKLYFNNRGHHRLSIAKILGLKKIPIKITLAKSIKNLEKFVL